MLDKSGWSLRMTEVPWLYIGWNCTVWFWMIVCGWTFCRSHVQLMVWHVSSPHRHVSGGIWRFVLSPFGGSKYVLRTTWSVSWLGIWHFVFGFSVGFRCKSVFWQRQNDGFSSWQRFDACESFTGVLVFGVEYNWIRPIPWSIDWHPIISIFYFLEIFCLLSQFFWWQKHKVFCKFNSSKYFFQFHFRIDLILFSL